ncbi:MAG TPA: transposase [Bacteroidales bacterium]|nr:transposase [Bacteroidales bacterium]
MADTKTPLEADSSYHIYNRAVGKELLFKTEENYSFFLRRFKKYLSPFVDVYAYCLIPNHFHLIIRVKSEREVRNEYQQIKNAGVGDKLADENFNVVPKIISLQFSHFFNSYAQAFNKENHRKGSLFSNRYKRIQIRDEDYLKRLIIYTHKNPVNHRLVDKPKEWKFSSYNTILSEKESILMRREVIELFDDIENFNYCHL